jgi:hypothetical protein
VADRPLNLVPSVRLAPVVDDGWGLQEERAPARTVTRPPVDRDERHVTDLIRDALAILDGVAPDEVRLSGDGWSLVDPEAPRPRATSPQLLGMIHDALAEADSQGWLLESEGKDAIGEAAVETAADPADPPPQYSIHRRIA